MAVVTDQVVLLLNPSDGSQLGKIAIQESDFHRVAFDIKNRLLIEIGKKRNSIRPWTLDGKSLGEIKVHSNFIYGLDITSNGEIISGGRDHRVCFSTFDLSSNSVLLGSHPNAWIWSLAFSDDDRLLASCGSDAKVKIWDVQSQKLVLEMGQHRGSVQFVVFSPDNQTLASASRDKTIRLTDIGTGETRAVLTKHEGDVKSLSFSSDGKRLVSGGNDGRLIVWDVGKNQPEFEYQIKQDGAKVWAVTFGPHDEGIYFGFNRSQHDPYLSILGKPNTVTWEQQVGFDVTSLVLSPDGKKLSATTSDGVIRVFDHTSKQQIYTLTGHAAADVMFTAYSPDMTTLASACHDGYLRFWNLATRERTAAIKAHEEHIHSVRFSKDGRSVASGAWDGNIRLWQRD